MEEKLSSVWIYNAREIESFSMFELGGNVVKLRAVIYSVDVSEALRLTATNAPLAERCIRILPMNQHDLRPITFGMK
jgi:hypothetical protein